MSANQNQDTLNQTFKTAIEAILRDALAQFNCHAVGTVNSFNPTTQVAKCSINYKKLVNGEARAYPPIECPIITLSGGAAHLTFPIAQGDTCLILFNDRSMDSWFKDGSVKAPSSTRLHAFSDGIALVGLRSLLNVIGGAQDPTNPYDTTHALLAWAKVHVGVSATQVRIANAAGTLGTALGLLTTALTALNGGLVTATTIADVNAAATAAATDLGLAITDLSGLLE